MNAPSAYFYKSLILCPDCTIKRLPTAPGERFDGWAVSPAARPFPTAEQNLDELAYAFGFDRSDQDSFSSDDFPQSYVTPPSYHCEACGDEV